MNSIPPALLKWYDAQKRTLPWRDIGNPYATWISEIMLQQTQVSTVIPYFNRFMARFPTLNALAEASLEEVLMLWQGLGYYSRARSLKKGAEQILSLYGGTIPKDEKALLEIAGIGPYTAGAILSIAYGLPVPAIDGNAIRVLSRIFGIREDVTHKATLYKIRGYAQELLAHGRPGDFNQALMDLGASICNPGAPQCSLCPISAYCDAFENGDQAELPIKTRTRPPKAMDIGVGLITCQGRIWVTKRKERMLSGLYVFFINEESSRKDFMAQALANQNLPCRLESDLGEARHVFTHRIWNMRLYHFAAQTMATMDCGQWVTADELLTLPFPAAMRTARERALALLT